MKRFWLALAGALMFANAAHASLVTCGAGSTTFSGYGTELFGNSFSSAQHFSECYSFTLTKKGTSSGTTIESDPLSSLNIDVRSITLSGGNLVTSLVDYTPGTFAWDNLEAGIYQLIVTGDVTRSLGGLDLPVSYGGVLTFSPVAAVPESSTLAMMILGFVGVGLLAYRRRKQSAALAA